MLRGSYTYLSAISLTILISVAVIVISQFLRPVAPCTLQPLTYAVITVLEQHRVTYTKHSGTVRETLLFLYCSHRSRLDS